MTPAGILLSVGIALAVLAIPLLLAGPLLHKDKWAFRFRLALLLLVWTALPIMQGGLYKRPELGAGSQLMLMGLLMAAQCFQLVYLVSRSRVVYPSKIYRVLVAWPGAAISASLALSVLSWMAHLLANGAFWILSIIGIDITIQPQSSAWLVVAWYALPWIAGIVGALGVGRYRIERYELTHPQWSGPPLRLAILADVHVGVYHGPDFLRSLVSDVARLEPHMILIAGDLLTQNAERDRGPLLNALRGLRAIAPVWACEGNHDTPVIAELRQELEAIGVHMLLDEVNRVDARPLAISGIRWRWGKGHEHTIAATRSIAAQVQELGGDLFHIKLLHDPNAIDYVDRAGVNPAHLVISGHMHGGQIGFNAVGIRKSLLGLRGLRDQGWWLDNGRRVHFVHRGTGLYGFPVRVGMSGELALVELRAGHTVDLWHAGWPLRLNRKD